MLLNCLTCGKTVSSKKDTCVYCSSDLSFFITEWKQVRAAGKIEKDSNVFKEKYAGTLLGMLLKTKAR